MTHHEGDVPAMPCEEHGNYLQHHRGFTQRQRAAIDLRVPDSGTPWIDIGSLLALAFAGVLLLNLIWPTSARPSKKPDKSGKRGKRQPVGYATPHAVPS